MFRQLPNYLGKASDSGGFAASRAVDCGSLLGVEVKNCDGLVKTVCPGNPIAAASLFERASHASV